MTVERQQDIVIGALNAAPGATVAAATKAEWIDPSSILTWSTVVLVLIQVAYYLWKWTGEYQDRRRERQLQEIADNLAARDAANDQPTKERA